MAGIVVWFIFTLIFAIIIGLVVRPVFKHVETPEHPLKQKTKSGYIPQVDEDLAKRLYRECQLVVDMLGQNLGSSLARANIHTYRYIDEILRIDIHTFQHAELKNTLKIWYWRYNDWILVYDHDDLGVNQPSVLRKGMWLDHFDSLVEQAYQQQARKAEEDMLNHAKELHRRYGDID